MTDLAALRREYAQKMLERAGVSSPRLEDAYATIPREDFLAPGPWSLFSPSGYGKTKDADPKHLYDDVLVALVPEKRINNGQPSGHAMWINAADPRPGEHVVHIGAGTGYYTALLAHLVGPTGRVTAIEFDADLAARALANLKPWLNVALLHGDGAVLSFDPADVIYVNAGVTRPANSWLDNLKQDGRLVLPFTASTGPGQFPPGVMFRFERRGDEYLVNVISAAGFVPFEGLREPEHDEALSKAFADGDVKRVTRLVRGGDWPDDNVWLRGPGWILLGDHAGGGGKIPQAGGGARA
ncbi:MAG: methyltransferase domain-containing protein [Hyphomonadaceae bacterium]